MSDLSRRALVTALPALIVPGAAAALTMAAPTNLARLIEIEREIARINAKIEATYPANVAAFRRMNAMRKGWQVPVPPGRWASARTRYEYEQAKSRWNRRLAQVREDAGLAATEGRLSDLRDKRDDLVGSVWFIPATDLATLQAKARMGQSHPNILGSVAADVLALTGGIGG